MAWSFCPPRPVGDRTDPHSNRHSRSECLRKRELGSSFTAISRFHCDSRPVFCRRSVRKVTRHSRLKKSLHREKGRPLDRAAVMGKMGAVKPIFKEGT